MFLMIKALATDLGVDFADPSNWRGGSGFPNLRSSQLPRSKLKHKQSSGYNEHSPKQWSLTKTETVNSLENWRQNLGRVVPLVEHYISLAV